MIDFRYNSVKELWLEFTTAVAKEKLKSYGAITDTACRTGFDDIVLAFGYNHPIHKDAQLVSYMLTGLPTRLKVTLAETNEALVGTRLFSVGGGLEYSYAFINKDAQKFVMYLQMRFIHFFNRHLFPIIPCNAVYAPGNLTDLLLSFQYRTQHDVLEFGFNPEIYSNTLVKSPEGNTTIPIRGRLFPYIDYAHTFKRSHPSRCGISFDIGYAYGAQALYNLNVHELWLDFILNF